MNVTLIQEKPDLELCKPGFLIIIKTTKDKSICHFRNKLNTNQPDFILGIVITQLIHRVIYTISIVLIFLISVPAIASSILSVVDSLK